MIVVEVYLVKAVNIKPSHRTWVDGRARYLSATVKLYGAALFPTLQYFLELQHYGKYSIMFSHAVANRRGLLSYAPPRLLAYLQFSVCDKTWSPLCFSH